MIKHIVTWRLKETEPKEKAKQANMIKETLEGLKSRISEIKSLEVGINAANADENNWDIILVSGFENFDDLDTYIKHADHQYVVAKVKPFFDARVCVDYEV